MVKLSQCMIVKNEEANIEKALSWAKDIAYEQIVVDTGSTDRTVELAKAMGAKVYDFKWIDDFSAAKNYAISKATGDWIAFLDADEYFNEEDSKKLMNYLEKLKNTQYLAIITSMLHLDDKGNAFSSGIHNRIFRNAKELYYCNAIHEALTFNGKPITSLSVNLKDELAIFHTGYAETVSKDKNKAERNTKILLKEIEKYPNNRMLMGYLGDSYLIYDNYEQAKNWFEKAIDGLENSVGSYDMRTTTSFVNLMKILYFQNEFERFLEVYQQAVRVVPEESDFDYLMSSYWIVKKNDFKEGIFYLEQAFEKLEANKESFYGKNLIGRIQKAWELRATCYFQLQNWTKCIESCVALLKEDAYRFGTTSMLLEVFRMDETKGGASASVVLQFLSNLYSLQSLKDRIYLLKVAVKIHYESLIQEIRNLCTQQELEAIDSAMGKIGEKE